MKKRIAIQFTAVISALLLFVSCARQNTGEVSSVLAQSDKQNIISSWVSKEETSSDIASMDDQTNSQEKNENNEGKNTESKKSESKKPEKEETTSKRPTSSTASTSSNFKVKHFDDLSKEKEGEISACAKKENYEYQEGQYFGTYNQYDIVLISQIDGVEYRDSQTMKIAGYEFYIGDTEKLVAYKDNSYMLLSEAYSKGIITKADVQNISYLYRYSFYSKFSNSRLIVIMKKDPNNPDKQYTAADFPTIKIDKIIQYSWSTSPLGQDTQDITIVFPIYNRRNVINVLEKVKKMDGVLLAEPSYAMAPF